MSFMGSDDFLLIALYPLELIRTHWTPCPRFFYTTIKLFRHDNVVYNYFCYICADYLLLVMGIGLIGIFAVALIALILDITVGNFPYQIFCFPLNILVIALWLTIIVCSYRNRKESRFAKLMLSHGATWLALSLMAVVGVVLGLQRYPATTSWCVIVTILFVLTHLAFVILRGWRVNGRVRVRFILTHVGLWLALGAGFWGAPDREQLRLAVDSTPTNEAYTMQGTLHIMPYEICMEELIVERNEQGVATNYEARVRVANESVVLRVNHPYNRTLSQKIYLASVKESSEGSYAIIEVVDEPWQWLSMAGIVMLILGGLLLFLRGPQRGNNKCK